MRWQKANDLKAGKSSYALGKIKVISKKRSFSLLHLSLYQQQFLVRKFFSRDEEKYQDLYMPGKCSTTELYP
jgi:hypothetical protein